MAKKITVIGGSGFVGTNLCRQLSLKQQDFEIIDLKMSNQFPEKCKVADVRDVNSLREAITGDVVVNLAAVHRDDVRDKTEYQRTNVDGAENVARVCSEKGIKKIVFTSTVAVYGFAEPGTDENGGVDVLYDAVGGAGFEAGFRAMRPEGRILSIGFASGTVPQIPANHLLVKNLDVMGLYWGGYLRFNPEALQHSLEQVFGLYTQGGLKPHIGATYPFDALPAALDALRSHKSTGKLVIEIVKTL